MRGIQTFFPDDAGPTPREWAALATSSTRQILVSPGTNERTNKVVAVDVVRRAASSCATNP